MESDKKRNIADLKTPTFRWTDDNDAVRHLGVMRLQKRDEAKKLDQNNFTVKIDSQDKERAEFNNVLAETKEKGKGDTMGVKRVQQGRTKVSKAV